MLSPIVQTPRYRLVADEIAARIRAGDFAPGSKMPADKDLVAQLGVSRTTVREAMIALELMGYVVTRYGAGAFVADPLPDPKAGAAVGDPDDSGGLPGYFELVEARFAIEPEIAAIAADSVTPEDLEHLAECIEGMCDAALPLSRVEAHDRKFHHIIARSTGNAVFVWVVEEFWRVRLRYPEWTRLNNRQSAEDIARFSRDEHAAILQALRHGNANDARAAMQKHCHNSGAFLLERWRDHDGETARGGDEVVARLRRRSESLG